jgi:RNA polymerase sigma-70 factor, ECF subfamily
VSESTTGMPPAPDLRTEAPSEPTFDAPGLADRSDAGLLAAHCAGDPDAFGELFRRHRDRMWAVALRTCGDREIAADAVQDGFLAAFRRADSFRGDAAVTTWLHRIVVNACLDRLRRRRPTTPLPEHDSVETADRRDDHAGTEAALDVRAALARLPEAQRVALVLVDMHGMGVAEAADVLGVAEGTVKSRCARGRAALAELLGLDPRTGRLDAGDDRSDRSGSNGNRPAPPDV